VLTHSQYYAADHADDALVGRQDRIRALELLGALADEWSAALADDLCDTPGLLELLLHADDACVA
jgi:hypothetical protein